ncbi:MAG: aminotransferase class V-fold PLP-dependent enzyme [Sphingomicrobium sp.]
MTFKHLFAQSLGADPERLHLAAHSHHLWPDASFEGQVECWRDAAQLADSKWDKVMGEVWPEAQAHVARELGSETLNAVVFASNTHDLIIRLVAATPRGDARPLRILTTTGEFHSARRQFARWEEAGEVSLTCIDPFPSAGFSDRFLNAARGGHDLIFVSHVLFGSGHIFQAVEELADLGRPGGPWVVIDGYHAFMALPQPLGREAAQSAFYLAGGYKYAMAGEGCAFMHAPAGFGPRPPLTGWYAEFEDLSLPPGQVGYAPDARRFMGATFDPSGLYRFNAVQRMLLDHGLDTRRVSAHIRGLQERLLDAVNDTVLDRAELLNPLAEGAHARFMAFRSEHAQRWSTELKAVNCITDVRGDVLRIGLALYHDESDVERFAALAGGLR